MLPSARELDKLLAEASLYEFVRQAWAVREPNTPFVPGWHLEAICLHLEAVTDGRIRDLIINIPPGSTKSLTVCVFWQAWAWIARPHLRWLFSSYSMGLVDRDAGYCRQLMASDWYRSRWGHLWRFNSTASTAYQNDKTGARRGTSPDSGATGWKGDILVNDDAHNVKEVESDTVRDGTIRWHDEAFYNRSNDLQSGPHVNIGQRTHHQDLYGHLIKQGGWVVLNIPEEFEAGNRCTTPIGWSDPRTLEGELMRPERFGPAAVKAAKVRLGTYGWAAQHQQRPTPRSGGMFKREWFKTIKADALPQGIRKVRYWDKACLVKGTLVETARGSVPIESVVAGDFVLTRQGYKRVRWAGQTKTVDAVMSVSFANGSILTGTADHLVWTENRGWWDLASLTDGDYCLGVASDGEKACGARDRNDTSERKSSFSTASLTPGAQAGATSRRIAGTRSPSAITPTRCTGLSGGSTTAPSRTATTYTTRIETTTTTLSTTLSASATATICDPTGKSGTGTRSARSSASCVIARSAAASFLLAHGTRIFVSVPAVAGTSGEGEMPCEGVPVYDLQVEDVHEFFANGILVHNSSEATGAYSCGVKMGCHDETVRFFIFPDVRGQWSSLARNTIMRQTAAADGVDTEIRHEQEPGGGGKESAEITNRQLAGYSVRQDLPIGNKEARAGPFSAQCEAGNVYLVEGEWNEAYLDEVCLFPLTKYMDRVDASSGAFNHLALKFTSVDITGSDPRDRLMAGMPGGAVYTGPRNDDDEDDGPILMGKDLES